VDEIVQKEDAGMKRSESVKGPKKTPIFKFFKNQ
jgi:hypothetical protein